MPIDMLVLAMSDFDIVLGMDWLNKYRVVINCFNAILSFRMKDMEVEHKLMMLRRLSMLTKEL